MQGHNSPFCLFALSSVWSTDRCDVVGTSPIKKGSHISMVADHLLHAQDPSVAMSVEQAIHELQEQLQRVSAGHQAMHQELTTLRSMVDTRSCLRLVELQTLMPDRFGKKNGPSWKTWSYLARDFVGVVHVALKQAMKTAENLKQPIAVTHLQHEFGVTTGWTKNCKIS